MHVIPRDDPEYPSRLRDLESPPDPLTVSGPLATGTVVAIVGTREPRPESEAFAHKLAGAVVAAGGIVASGGAFGVDAAAHRGALEAGGRTWLVAPTGYGRVFPEEHAQLFAAVAESPESAILWPFAPGAGGRHPFFFKRNGVLAAFADAIVVIEAPIPSGALNTIRWGRDLSRPIWIAGAPPWEPWDKAFAGSFAELERGSERTYLLRSLGSFLEAVGLSSETYERSQEPLFKAARTLRLPTRPFTEAETRVLAALESGPKHASKQPPKHPPKHADEIALRVGLDAPTVMTALLTLALEDVVVEGPGGFFRRVRT